MNQNRRMGDRRKRVRRQSNEIMDVSRNLPWPFPIDSGMVLCGTCGERYSAQFVGGNAVGTHKCRGRA